MNPFRWILQHPTRPLSLWWLAAWVVIALIPLFLQAHWQLLAMQILIAMCATVGLNLIVGNAGQLVLSSAAFYALGAYCYAHAAHLLGSFAAAIILVIVVCTVAGLLIGLIRHARLRADHEGARDEPSALDRRRSRHSGGSGSSAARHGHPRRYGAVRRHRDCCVARRSSDGHTG
ncbi:MAG: hypothetical protein J0I75_01395 [Hyphomicrobium sp.]|nr:hypothetical protein [Hyphomicrobium sp.]